MLTELLDCRESERTFKLSSFMSERRNDSVELVSRFRERIRYFAEHSNLLLRMILPQYRCDVGVRILQRVVDVDHSDCALVGNTYKSLNLRNRNTSYTLKPNERAFGFFDSTIEVFVLFKPTSFRSARVVDLRKIFRGIYRCVNQVNGCTQCSKALRHVDRDQSRGREFLVSAFYLFNKCCPQSDRSCRECAHCNNSVYDHASGVKIHPLWCVRPRDEKNRQTTDCDRQQRDSSVFNRRAQGDPVFHFFPVFDFSAIVARPRFYIAPRAHGQRLVWEAR